LTRRDARNERRLIAVDKRLEPPEMRFVEWLRAADRHANTVGAKPGSRDGFGKCGHGAGRRHPCSFSAWTSKKRSALLIGQDCLQMFMLEARARHGPQSNAPESGRLPIFAQVSASPVLSSSSPPLRRAALPMIVGRDSNWLQRTVATARAPRLWRRCRPARTSRRFPGNRQLT